uniref:Putative ovule protein n=1 Tax=Solanum chacoense TaxID=4108 RepID=A0A0V0HAT3_SOLCH
MFSAIIRSALGYPAKDPMNFPIGPGHFVAKRIIYDEENELQRVMRSLSDLLNWLYVMMQPILCTSLVTVWSLTQWF